VFSLVGVDHRVPVQMDALAFFQVLHHLSGPLLKIINMFVLTRGEDELMVVDTPASMTHHIVDGIFAVDMVTLGTEE
jgi:hypothetical protein